MSDSAAIEKKIEELEAEMARTQKNKATNYHLVSFGLLFGNCVFSFSLSIEQN